MGAKEIANDGYLLGGVQAKFSDIALLSLRIAMKAYFSTYRPMRHSLHLYAAGAKLDDKTIEHNIPNEYCEFAAEAILHFQHFIELIVKDVLRREHQLLADIASDDAVILHKLLMGESLSLDEEKGLRSLEFSESYKRLHKLIAVGRVDAKEFGFIADGKPWIDQLNGLRNRIWHRGAYVLHYPALDEFVGRFILPFVVQVTNMKRYDLSLWRHKDLSCGIDPIEEIIKEVAQSPFDLKKVALLKELGRAAYNCPYSGSGFAKQFDDDLKSRMERAAEIEKKESGVSEIEMCPVCGTKSLVILDDIELEGEDPTAGSYDKAWRYTWQVECRACDFVINHHLDNASQYGLPIPDYWTESDL